MVVVEVVYNKNKENMEASNFKTISTEGFNNITNNTVNEPLNTSLRINEDGPIIIENNSNLA